MYKNHNYSSRILTLALVSSLVLSVSYIINYYNEKDSAIVQKPSFTETPVIIEESNITNIPQEEENEVEGIQAEVSPEPILMLPGYDELLNTNSDFIGWIEINDTQVNNPIVYPSQGNNYYLKHNFYNEKNSRGTLFIQENTSFNDHATIIYGHYMKDGTMFGELKKFTDESFFNDHQYITITNLYEEKTYEVIAVFKDYVHTVDDTSFKFYFYYGNPVETEFNRMISFITEKSIHSRNIEDLTIDDYIVQLVTCSYHVENGRLAILLREVK